MVNYSNGKIYKLVNNVDDKIYIGSTCNFLRVRKSEHKNTSRSCPNRNVYKHLNEVGWENVEIILIEAYECKNKDELHQRERHWIDELKPELNKTRPLITNDEKEQWKEEYYNKNKVEINKKNNQYYEDNKEKMDKWRCEKTICECGGKYINSNRKRHMKSKKHINFINQSSTSQ